MKEREKLIKLSKMFKELDRMFPAGSIDINIHHIGEKNIPEEEFERMPDFDKLSVKVYKDKTRKSLGFGITIFTEEKKYGDEFKEEK